MNFGRPVDWNSYGNESLSVIRVQQPPIEDLKMRKVKSQPCPPSGDMTGDSISGRANAADWAAQLPFAHTGSSEHV